MNQVSITFMKWWKHTEDVEDEPERLMADSNHLSGLVELFSDMCSVNFAAVNKYHELYFKLMIFGHK